MSCLRQDFQQINLSYHPFLMTTSSITQFKHLQVPLSQSEKAGLTAFPCKNSHKFYAATATLWKVEVTASNV